MIETLPAWLTESVPLYAFLIALLTNPYAWSDKASKILSNAYNRRFANEVSKNESAE